MNKAYEPEGKYPAHEQQPAHTARAYSDYVTPQSFQGYGLNGPTQDSGYGKPQIASIIRVNY